MAINGTTNTTNLEFCVEYGEGMWQDTAQTTAAEDTDPVERWEDQSGNSYDLDQTTTANQPTVGTEAIYPDNSNDYMSADAVAGTITGDAITVYIVLDMSTWDNNLESTLEFKNSAGSEYFKLDFRGIGSARLAVNTDTESRAFGPSIPASDKVIYTLTFGGGNTEVYDNEGGFATRTIAGSITFDTFTLFAFDGGSGSGTIGIVACYVYSELHDTTEREGVEDELTAYWLSSEIVVTPSAKQITLSVPTSTVALESPIEVTPSPATVTLSVPTSSVALENPIEVTPVAKAITLSVPTSTVSLESPIEITPSPAVITLSVPTSSVTLESPLEVTPDPATVTLSVPASTVTLENPIEVTPNPATITLNVPSSVVGFVSNDILVFPDPVPITLSVPTSTVSLESPLEVTPNPAAIVLTAPTASVALENPIEVTPAPVAITLSVPTAVVTVGDVAIVAYAATTTLRYPTATITLRYPTATTEVKP